MEKTGELSKGLKVVSVILGFLCGGFMWRCRGEGGFGSSWGLYCVGLTIMLLVYNFYGKRNGMKFEMIPFGALLMGVGVNGYATVIEQTAGVLYSDLPYKGEVVYSPINPYSGLIIELFMGLTFIPLFSIFVSSLFSGKKYKYYHYLIMIALYFGVSYICKATVAHPILKVINPEQVNYAALGLKDCGFDYASPMQAYMSHFADRGWTQEIPYFENYFMSIDHISDCIAILSIFVYVLIALKDKVAVIMSAVMNLFVSCSSVFFSFMIAAVFKSGFYENMNLPRFIAEGAGWGIWEYMTGASVGFIVMLVLALMPKKYTALTTDDCEPLFKNEKINYLVNIVLSVFILALAPCRATGLRIGKLLENEGVLEDESPTGDIIMIVLTVLLGLFFVYFIGKNLLKLKKTPLGVTPFRFAGIAFPSFMILCCILYFFTNHAYAVHFPYKELFGNFFYTATSGECIEQVLMFISFILFAALYFPAKKKLIKVFSD